MPSRRRSSPPEPPAIVFFLDRGLGRRHVAGMLVAAGFQVMLMADVYPDGRDQEVDDPTWIRHVSAAGWVALTEDAGIVRDHVDALDRSVLRVFALDSANLTGEEMADRYRTHLNRIIQRASKPGPYVYVVHHKNLELRWHPKKGAGW